MSTGMKALVAAFVVCLALGSTAAGATESGGAPVLGIDWRWPHRALVHVDPLTFRQVGKGRVPLGEFTNLYAVSPDRKLFVAAPQDRPVLRVVDLGRFRAFRDIELAADGTVDEIEWFDARHVAVTVRDARATTVYVVDPRASPAPTALRFRGMDVGFFRQAGDKLVALGAPLRRIGVARLIVFTADGSVRATPVTRIRKGELVRNGRIRRMVQPGLAVDGVHRRAFVVDHDGTVAEVRLSDLAVSYHQVRRKQATQRTAKDGVSGWQVQARFERGRLLVSGYRIVKREPSFRSVGLRAINTTTWTSRLVDPEAGSFNVVDGLVLASSGTDAIAYRLDGRQVWRLAGGALFSIARPYVHVDTDDGRETIATLRTGRVLGVVEQRDVRVLHDPNTW
jgi:hypothetical protein